MLVNAETFELIRSGGMKKGDVLDPSRRSAASWAQSARRRSYPMCHPIMISGVDIDISLCEERLSVEIVATTKCTGATGVEMEALTAVSSVAALTVYDMCKAVQRDIEITDIRLLKKTGGKSGVFRTQMKSILIDRNGRHDRVAVKRQTRFRRSCGPEELLALVPAISKLCRGRVRLAF